MLTHKTKCGFEAAIDERIKDDYRFVRAYKKMNSKDENESIIGMDEMLDAVLGVQQADDLIAYLVKHDGYASTEKVLDVITEVIEALGKSDAGKNS